MTTVNMHDAKSNLSRLVDSIESGAEAEIIIARNGRPAARLVALNKPRRPMIFGGAKGLMNLPDDFDADDALIAAMFNEAINT
jgi:prevent-host-death family protein